MNDSPLASQIYKQVLPGDPAAWFTQRSPSNRQVTFDNIAGRYVVLCFFVSAVDPLGRKALAAVRARRRIFDDKHAAFFGVSIDPRDEAESRVANQMPGVRFFFDFDLTISRLYGSVPGDATVENGLSWARQFWLVLDPTLRVMKRFSFAPDSGDHALLFSYLERLPPPELFAGYEIQAPILHLPNVFEPEFCSRLIALYEAHGGSESGFMREVDGKTVGVYDNSHKSRKDYTIEDSEVSRHASARIARRVVPEILKVHQFKVTRMERHIVACYAAEDDGHFRPHRDNRTKGTAHRRFAVSINLNDDFDGGDLYFPEYGARRYKPPPGGAVVFSGSLLHAVSRVTRGRRYAFLPFLYDEEAAKLREENSKFLTNSARDYKSRVA